MTPTKRTVLITGCSDGGLGSALAIALHNAGLRVYATARNPSKMTYLSSLGIQTLQLDVLSFTSISACVSEIPHLDILINNAGGGYSMPISDLSLPDAKKLFDLNVWSCIEVTQAFLPLLLKSQGMVVNHTSVGALCAIPFQSTYNASKAAMATFSRTLRMELAPLGVTVVEIRTGGVISNFLENKNDEGKGAMLPEGSVYEPAKEEAEEILRGKFYKERMEPAEKWADGVVKDLLSKKPPSTIWRGAGAGMAKYTTFLPDECMDGLMRQISKFDAVEKVLRG